MKLYIPTCTLNFNNIFSTESISPKGYYARRGFGNKRFYAVDPNPYDSVILLYSKYPEFKIQSSDIENYPMVIEIDTDDYKKDTFVKQSEFSGTEVYSCSQTIYLNPFHVLAYFNSYMERQDVITKAKQSLENKYSDLYSNNLVVKEAEQKSLGQSFKEWIGFSSSDSFVWKADILPDLSGEPLNDEGIKRDVFMDRLKGFAFCYLIGANSSVSKEIGEMKALARSMSNTLSAIVNSPDHRPTESQDASLTKDINRFNELYRTKDPNFAYNESILDARMGKNPLSISRKDVETLLDYLGVKDYFYSKLNLRRVYDAYDLWDCVNSIAPDSYERAITNLKSAIAHCEAAEASQNSRVDLSQILQFHPDGRFEIIDKTFNQGFYSALIFSQIKGEYVKLMEEMEITDESLGFAVNGGKILKNLMGDKWDNSSVSNYINALLSHLQENSRFDLFSYNNEVMESFAAFCQKGDNIDRLKDYLIQCGFSNYKLAYGIFGATRGFASLPKTFTSTVINSDSEYFKSTYLYFYKSLFEIEIANAEFPSKTLLKSPKNISSQWDTMSQGNIPTYISDVDKPVKQDKETALADLTMSPSELMQIFSVFFTKRTKAYKELKDSGWEDNTTSQDLGTLKQELTSIVYPVLSTRTVAEDKGKINVIFAVASHIKEKNNLAIALENLGIDDKNRAKLLKIANNLSKKPRIAPTFFDSKSFTPVQDPSTVAGSKSHSFSYQLDPKVIRKPDYILTHCQDVIAFIVDKCKLSPEESKKFETDFKWIIQTHKDGGYTKKDGTFVSVSDNTNSGIIEHFNKNSRGIYAKLPDDVVDKIVDRLRKIYVGNGENKD